MTDKNSFEEFRKGGISQSVLNALFFRLAGLLLIFLLQVTLARLMGPRQYGDYVVIITTVNLLLVFSMFGFDSSVLRFLPSFLEKKNYSYETDKTFPGARTFSVLFNSKLVCTTNDEYNQGFGFETSGHHYNFILYCKRRFSAVTKSAK
jgi:hypothetical protein